MDYWQLTLDTVYLSAFVTAVTHLLRKWVLMCRSLLGDALQINWCLKGIRSQTGFGDAEALNVLGNTGIQSSWLFNNGSMHLAQATVDGQNALSATALDDHINNFATVSGYSPYISLSAGCREFAGSFAPASHYPALVTALDFATDWGRVEGYIFRCWVVTAPQVSASIPGLADEVRDLNLFGHFTHYHHEGEIAAKLLVPRRQVQWVHKVDASGAATAFSGMRSGSVSNSDFVYPETVSNLIPELI